MALVQSFSSKGSVFGPGLSTDWHGNRQNQHGFERSGRLGRLSQNRASPFLSLCLSLVSALVLNKSSTNATSVDPNLEGSIK